MAYFLLDMRCHLLEQQETGYVALLTMEVKYLVGEIIVHEVTWLQSLLNSLEIIAQALKLVTLHNDRIMAKNYYSDSEFHGRTKHIKIKNHFIRNLKMML